MCIRDRPEREQLGETVELTLVKIRRRLIARDSSGFQVMSTSQHEHPNSTVTLWRKDSGVVASGPAREIREQYPDLRTVQEIYALLNGELVLLIVKGASLGSKNRDKDFPSFYEYVSSLNKAGGIFTKKTIVGGVLEAGAKSYYTMIFSEGEETTDKELTEVLKASDELTETIKKYDEEQKAMVVTNEHLGPVDDEVEPKEEDPGEDADNEEQAF